MILKRMLSRILGARTVRWDQDTNGYRHLPQRHAICYAPSSRTSSSSSSSSSSSLLSPKCENPYVALYAWQYVGPLSRAKFVIEFDLNMAKNGLKGERDAKWKSRLPDWNHDKVFKKSWSLSSETNEWGCISISGCWKERGPRIGKILCWWIKTPTTTTPAMTFQSKL